MTFPKAAIIGSHHRILDQTIPLVDHLFANHYNTLPVEQPTNFKKQINAAMAINWRIAPDFSWTKTATKSLYPTSMMGLAIYYFYTSCPHCLREVPKV